MTLLLPKNKTGFPPFSSAAVVSACCSWHWCSQLCCSQQNENILPIWSTEWSYCGHETTTRPPGHCAAASDTGGFVLVLLLSSCWLTDAKRCPAALTVKGWVWQVKTPPQAQNPPHTRQHLHVSGFAEKRPANLPPLHPRSSPPCHSISAATPPLT